MKNMVVYLVILGICCIGSGIAIGMVIEKNYTKSHLSEIAKGQFMKNPQAFKKDRKEMHEQGKKKGQKMLEKTAEQLGLSEEQKETMKTIMEGAKQQIQQAREEFRAQLPKLREESHQKILELLTPEQQEKFEQLTKERHEKMKKFRDKFSEHK